MCGICGIINFNNQPVQDSSIRCMMQKMKHRGPDDEGVLIEDNIGLGFVRLSIIDLSPAGHQPMFSFDKRYVIVYNGEIYNYIELRQQLIDEGFVFSTQTDTEVLLNAYIKWYVGIWDTRQKCRNSFCIARPLWNKAVILFTDE
jgi:asparagine synthase (glutamine-hydrolysing)